MMLPFPLFKLKTHCIDAFHLTWNKPLPGPWCQAASERSDQKGCGTDSSAGAERSLGACASGPCLPVGPACKCQPPYPRMLPVTGARRLVVKNQAFRSSRAATEHDACVGTALGLREASFSPSSSPSLPPLPLPLFSTLCYFSSSYRKLGATNMEPTFARRAFPCFDEPEMKATFALRMMRDENYYSLFNMPLVSASLLVASFQQLQLSPASYFTLTLLYWSLQYE